MHDSQTLVPTHGRLFLAPEPPDCAAVVVRRPGSGGGDDEFLLLHRSFAGPGFEGDWAWGPPAGGRLPGETPEACARRELAEETGLAVPMRPLPSPSPRCACFVADADADAEVVLSDEHDRFEWVDRETARRRCRPAAVAELFRLDLTA